MAMSALLHRPVLRRMLLRGGAARALSTQRQTTRPNHPINDFNEMRERSLLRHVISTSTEGDPDSVTAAMDVFWDTYFNGEGTAAWRLRGQALEQAIRAKGPTTAMEIGSYCGYTAVAVGRLMPPGGKLVSVEIDPLYAAIATKVVEHAGLSDCVSVEIGSVGDKLQAMKRKHSLEAPLDALVMDHEVESYLPDLKLLEDEGMVTQGTIVLCDWSLYPGDEEVRAPTDASEFMTYLKATSKSTTSTSLRNQDVFTVSEWNI